MLASEYTASNQSKMVTVTIYYIHAILYNINIDHWCWCICCCQKCLANLGRFLQLVLEPNELLQALQNIKEDNEMHLIAARVERYVSTTLVIFESICVFCLFYLPIFVMYCWVANLCLIQSTWQLYAYATCEISKCCWAVAMVSLCLCREERRVNRSLIEQQDQAYLESERQDREKVTILASQSVHKVNVHHACW